MSRFGGFYQMLLEPTQRQTYFAHIGQTAGVQEKKPRFVVGLVDAR